MAKSSNEGTMMPGFMQAAKALATGAPAALATDTALAFAPVGWSYNVREAVRLGAGVVGTAAALMLGVPSDWAVGPLAANGAVTTVQAGRQYGLAQRLRDAMRPAAT